jgi:hypothetical protein
MSVAINGSGTITGISVGGLPDGSITNDDLAGSITDAKLSGTTCKAFVNFNGTGTPAISAQFNVSSITDNGTGDYTLNFTTALADANYCAVGSAGRGGAGGGARQVATNAGAAPTTSACRINTSDSAGVAQDLEIISVSIFR